MLKEKPVQVDCQTGNVQDVCNGNAEISNYLTNLLCFSPKEDGCSGICQIRQYARIYFPFTRVNEVGDGKEEAAKPKKSKKSASSRMATASVVPFPTPTAPYFETPIVPSSLRLVCDNMLQVPTTTFGFTPMTSLYVLGSLQEIAYVGN